MTTSRSNRFLLIILLLCGCSSLMPREKGLVLIEECREEPGVELTCEVSPRGFNRAAFMLVIPYVVTAEANTAKAFKAANRERGKVEKSVRLMKSLRVHNHFGANLELLKPGDDEERRTATKVWK